jgi:hypothetical protein
MDNTMLQFLCGLAKEAKEKPIEKEAFDIADWVQTAEGAATLAAAMAAAGGGLTGWGLAKATSPGKVDIKNEQNKYIRDKLKLMIEQQKRQDVMNKGYESAQETANKPKTLRI